MMSPPFTLPAGSHIGYCTNVHAGADLAATRANLERYAAAVARRVSGGRAMPIGLWLSNNTARSLVGDAGAFDSFRQFLDESRLLPFTLNGFPFGDFHREVVKHDVYLPTWAQHKRLAYTVNLIDLLHRLLPEGEVGSISTLPLRWGEPGAEEGELTQHAVNLARAAEYLARLEGETGRLIHLCIEPEPGCLIQRTGDLIGFYEGHLLRTGNEKQVRRHIRVCHDVCHAAVMFEGQGEVVERYRAAGISIGKVQVSSAVAADLGEMDEKGRAAALEQLRSFNEPRYLHQTVVRTGEGVEHFFEDLHLALDTVRSRPALGVGWWRVHFHVPVFVERFGALRGTREEIGECMGALAGGRGGEGGADVCRHFEVETYAWPVLPEELREGELAAGIARELEWFRGQTSHG